MLNIAFFISPEWNVYWLFWLRSFIEYSAANNVVDVYFFDKRNKTLPLRGINLRQINYAYAPDGFIETKRCDADLLMAYLPNFVERENVAYLFERFSRHTYDYAIANEKSALAIMSFACQAEIRQIYWSTELYTAQNRMYETRFDILNELERARLPMLHQLIIQDEKRYEEYKKIVGEVSSDKLFFMPISSKRYAPFRGKLWHKIFDLPTSQKVVLYNGMIAKSGRYIYELVDAAQHFREDIVLILHGPYFGDYALLESIKIMDKKSKVFIYDKVNISDEERHKLISSADIGIALYDNLSANNELTSRSSEKLASYTRAGLPIVTFGYPNYVELFQEYCFGMTIREVGELCGALDVILSDVKLYSKNSKRAYDALYCLDINMDLFFDHLSEVRRAS